MSIRVEKIVHRNEERLALYMPYHAARIIELKRIRGGTFSKTRKCWHFPYNKASYYTLAALPWVEDIMPMTSTSGEGENNTLRDRNVDKITKKAKVLTPAISPYWMEQVSKYKIYLRQKRYAESTIKTYLMCIKKYLAWWGDHPAESMTIEHLITYSDGEFIKKKFSRSYQNQWVTSIKQFLLMGGDIDIPIEKIERPNKSHSLPSILSQSEVRALIHSYKNYKHKTIIMMYYACGLRKSELIDLKIKDIDSTRNVIRIRNSKGAKDRDIALPQNVLKMLRRYYTLYAPQEYLFNGMGKIKYSASSINKILSGGLRRAGIKKHITVHGLRHSYATHLVEKNINLRYIQEALGHKSSKTTELYTKLSKEHMANMVSPVDDWENI